MDSKKEFDFTDRDFTYIRKLVGESTGIVLADAKRQMVYSRLSRRVRALGLTDFQSYCQRLKDGDDSELVNFVNAVTTNLTSFFRELHHFEFLTNRVFPELLKKNADSRRIRIWSAGCSTGEEPYSLAMTIAEYFRKHRGWDIKVLATDLDSDVLDTAKNGVYKTERIENLDKKKLRDWFQKGNDGASVKVKDSLKEWISFRQLNLMNDWPFNGPFDVIFCRNVIIYFSKDTQKVLVNRYADMLADNSYLLLGHSESLFKVTDRFELLGNTIYQKTK